MTGAVAVGFLDPGHWSHCFGQSLQDMYLTDAFGSKRMVPHGKQLRVLCQAGGIVAGRNNIMKQFLDSTDCEWLFMVDSDMGFGVDTVDRLIASADPVERPVVGGLCFSLRASDGGEFYGTKYVVVPTCFEFVETPTEVGFRSIIDYPRDAMLEVSGTGAACLMIHRSAVEKVRAKYGDRWFEQVAHPSGTVFSEDLSFCVRLAGCDLPVFVDTSVRTTHDKRGVFLDEDEFDRCQALHASIPRFVVIPGLDRHGMTADLLKDLRGQGATVLLYDNGSSPPYDFEGVEIVDARGWDFHRMWAHGLATARERATVCDVAFLNNDLRVGSGFLARLSGALRLRPDAGLVFPSDQLGPGQATPVPAQAMQTMTGFAFMIRGDSLLQVDEQFEFWYGDFDLEMQARAAGQQVVAVGGCQVKHLEPCASTRGERLEQARRDEKRFATKWDLDPASLFLACTPDFGAS